MFKNSLLIAMKENGEDIKIISKKEAKDLNSKKYGIFFTINGFKDRRIKDNLLNINAWAIDIDNYDKSYQVKLIEKSPLPPSIIIESKNGYHVYWLAKNASAENYSKITADRLIPFFEADSRAKDICRILRYPNYFHWKDEDNPFLVKIIFLKKVRYSEKDMLRVFPEIKKNKYLKNINIKYDNMKALEILSGKDEVKNERFSFKRNSNGTYQILVNGKNTSSWIDLNGNIGSYDRGGVTVFQWVKWYGYSNSEVYNILNKYNINNI